MYYIFIILFIILFIIILYQRWKLIIMGTSRDLSRGNNDGNQCNRLRKKISGRKKLTNLHYGFSVN